MRPQYPQKSQTWIHEPVTLAVAVPAVVVMAWLHVPVILVVMAAVVVVVMVVIGCCCCWWCVQTGTLQVQ